MATFIVTFLIFVRRSIVNLKNFLAYETIKNYETSNEQRNRFA